MTAPNLPAEPTPSEQLAHTRSCPSLTPLNDDPCTCGLIYRQREQTAVNISAAWRKRAEEAESEIDALRSQLTAALALLAEREKDAKRWKQFMAMVNKEQPFPALFITVNADNSNTNRVHTQAEEWQFQVDRAIDAAMDPTKVKS